MKRCPQCAFIYEEDQRLCDMDGTELVHDSRPLPGNPPPQQEISPEKPGRKHFAMGAIAGVILLFTGFYVFTHRTAPQNTSDSSSIVAADPQSSLNAVLPPATSTATPFSSKTKEPTAKVNRFKSSPSRIVTPSPRYQSPARKRPEQESKPENTIAQKESEVGKPKNSNVKKQSKISSILKKTGRLLKKPFRF